MRRFTPGRTGSAPVSISWLKMSVFSSCSSLRKALRAAGSAPGQRCGRAELRQGHVNVSAP